MIQLTTNADKAFNRNFSLFAKQKHTNLANFLLLLKFQQIDVEKESISLFKTHLQNLKKQKEKKY